MKEKCGYDTEPTSLCYRNCTQFSSHCEILFPFFYKKKWKCRNPLFIQMMHVDIQYYSMTASFIFLCGCRNTIILWYTPPIYYPSDDVKVQLVDPAIGLVRGVSTRCCSSQEYSYHFWLEAPIAFILNGTDTQLPIITRMFSFPFSSCLMP